MNIEKTFKLTIKDTAFNLTEEEVSALYETCRKALNISITSTNPVKPFDNPTYPTWPNTYPSWPVYPGTGTNPIWHTTVVSSGDTNSINNSVMDTDWHNWHANTGTGIKCANVPTSKGINFLSDDMATIKENDKWRSSIQKSLDKLSAKTIVTTSEGIKVG